MPTDIWVPALNGLKPLQSDQVNMGISYDFNKTVLISAEVYRKWLYNTTDYQNGVSLTTDFIPWYNKVTQGNGNTKGVELSIEKQTGPLTGSISYTFSISDRNYDELNNGITFPFIYDRRHDFNISGNYKISGKWDISALWFFGTGYPVTLPTEKYLPALGISGSDNNGNYFGQQIDYYPSPNNSRLPAYHRLDLSLHYNNHNRWGKYTWSFDIFNAYNRKNPIYMYYIDTSIKYANLLPIIPSVTYTLRF